MTQSCTFGNRLKINVKMNLHLDIVPVDSKEVKYSLYIYVLVRNSGTDNKATHNGSTVLYCSTVCYYCCILNTPWSIAVQIVSPNLVCII